VGNEKTMFRLTSSLFSQAPERSKVFQFAKMQKRLAGDGSTFFVGVMRCGSYGTRKSIY
jgi:hypothetical protein